MSDEDEVVDFGAASDASFPDGSPVDTGVCLHLDVVLKYRGAGLKHFAPPTVSLFGETKAVAANHHAVLQHDPVAEAAKLTHHHMSMREEVVANLRSAIESDEAVQHRIAANFHLFVNVAIRSYMRSLTNPGAFRDDRRRMNPWRIAWRLIEKLDRLSKCQIWITRAQRRECRQRRRPVQRNSIFDKNSRGAGRLKQRKVPPIRKEGDLPRFRMLDPGHAVNLKVRRALQSASQFLRNFSKFHEGAPQFFLGPLWAACESRTGQRGKYSRPARLLVEKAGLGSRGRGSGWLPARDAYHPQYGHFRECGPRNKDTISGRVQVRGCDLQPIIQQRQQVVRHHAF